MVLPSSVGSTYLPSQLRGPTIVNTTGAGVSPVLQPFVIRHGAISTMPSVHDSGPQFRSSSIGPISPRTSGSATVHHLGTADVKESPFVHLRGHLQSIRAQEPAAKIPLRHPSAESSECDKPLAKRIKLEVQDESSGDSYSAKFYRKLYVESHEKDMTEIRNSYQEHITEQFFLANQGNLMDYLVWSKRPNVNLSRLWQAENLDADNDGTLGEEEKRINNEASIKF